MNFAYLLKIYFLRIKVQMNKKEETLMNFRSIVLAAVSLLSTGVNAAVVELDFAGVGDGLITRDVDNAKEWFDVAATTGLSANEAESLYASAGFRLATADEVVDLFISAGIDEILDMSVWPPLTVYGDFVFSEVTYNDKNVSSEEGKAAVSDLMRLLGYTETEFGGTFNLQGYLTDEDLDGLVSTIFLREADPYFDAMAHINYGGDYYEPDTATIYRGSMLVREAAAVVPVPTAIWLFGSGLIGLFALSKRNRV